MLTLRGVRGMPGRYAGPSAVRGTRPGVLTSWLFFFFQAEDGIRDIGVTGVQTCALPICQKYAYYAAMGAAAVVLGASGYAGGEVLRLLSRHPAITPVVAAAGSSAGKTVAEIGRASWRERGEVSVGGVMFKKKQQTRKSDP